MQIRKEKAMVPSQIFLVHIFKDRWALDIASLNRGNLVFLGCVPLFFLEPPPLLPGCVPHCSWNKGKEAPPAWMPYWAGLVHQYSAYEIVLMIFSVNLIYLKDYL
jgi:hypothetical protein